MAVTFDFDIDKVNSDLYVVGELVGTGHVRAYKAEFTELLTSDTRPDGDNTAIAVGTLRQVANELNALLFESKTTPGATGEAAKTTVGFVTEFHHVDPASLKRRLEHIVGGTVTVTEVGLNLA